MRLIHLFAALLVAILWGINFVAAKYALAYFPPVFFTCLRFIFVSAVIVPFVPRLTVGQIRRILPVSALFTLHFSLMFAGLAYGLDIATSALVGQLGVPTACLLGALFLKDRLGPWRTMGIVISFIGIGIVAGTPNITSNMTAFILALISSTLWGVAQIFVKRTQDLQPMQMLGWVSLGSVPMLMALSLLFEFSQWPPLGSAPLTAWAGLAYTVIGSTLIAYGLWYYLLSKYTVSQVTPFSLLVPMFGIAAGQIFFAEALTHHIILGGIITLAGVGVIVIRRPKLALFSRSA